MAREVPDRKKEKRKRNPTLPKTKRQKQERAHHKFCYVNNNFRSAAAAGDQMQNQFA